MGNFISFIRSANRFHSVPLGFSLIGLAGILSGLLGIGSGAFKVLAMDRVMRLLFKVSTTTSNFTIGVTAAASAGVYLARRYIDPGLSIDLEHSSPSNSTALDICCALRINYGKYIKILK